MSHSALNLFAGIAFSALSLLAAPTAMADDASQSLIELDEQGNPAVFYLYFLNADGTDFSAEQPEPVCLGSESLRLTNVMLTQELSMAPTTNFTISTDAQPSSLAEMKGRVYPASAQDADLTLFKRTIFSHQPADGAPAYWTTNATMARSLTKYYIFLGKSDQTWEGGKPHFQHNVLYLLPHEDDIDVEITYGDPANGLDELSLTNRGVCNMRGVYRDGVYSFRFLGASDAKARFAFSFDNGMQYLHPQNNENFANFDKYLEGKAFVVDTKMTDQNGQYTLYETPELSASAPYEIILDVNNMSMYDNKAVYVNHWMQNDALYYNPDMAVCLYTNFVHQGEPNRKVEIPGTRCSVNVKGHIPRDYDEWVWAYKFQIDYDIVTYQTQNYFYFGVDKDIHAAGRNEHGTTLDQDFMIYPASRNQNVTVGESYDEATPSTTFESEPSQFAYGKFEPGKHYFVFYEPASGRVWMQAEDATVTGIDDVETADDDANAPAEYYDLQGRRVASPSHGLYIERRGTHTAKVAL